MYTEQGSMFFWCIMGVDLLHCECKWTDPLSVHVASIDLFVDGCVAVPCVFDLQDTWRDVPYDWASLLENVLDASHVPFTHHK
jgi:hypothetical protein